MKITKGDITEVKEGVIFQQVNCRNRMGAGLAKAIYNKWPQVKEEYHEFCEGKSSADLLGDYHFVKINDDLSVCNIFGQLDCGSDGALYTNYSALTCAFLGATYSHKCYDKKIYFPYKFGCGLAGGDWEIVSKIILACFPDAQFVELS